MDLRVEAVLGKKVRAPDGRFVGRLEELRAEEQDGELVVVEYLVGTAALLQRLSANVFPFLGFGLTGYRVRWDQMDWRDPESPRLACGVSELRRFDTGRRRLTTGDGSPAERDTRAG